MTTSGKFYFLPGIELNLPDDARWISIKGRLPQADAKDRLFSIYARTPSLEPLDAYHRLYGTIQNMDAKLRRTCLWWRVRDLPVISDDDQARQTVLALLGLNSWQHGVSPRQGSVLVESAKCWWVIPAELRPFSFALAPEGKLIDSFLWIDSNVRLKVDEVLRHARMPGGTAPIIVETVLTLFSLLLKMDDYSLARALSFNFSAFLQARLIAFVLGEDVVAGSERARVRVRRLKADWDNRVALRLLHESDEISDLDLCRMGVAMGVVWVERPEHGVDERMIPNSIVDIAGQALSAIQSFCVDHCRELVCALYAPQEAPVVVVLDDNGESVFDLALFQRVLASVPELSIVFVVNRFPVSNNICLPVFNALLREPFFSELQRFRAEGRVTVLVEEQPFMSFEEHALSDQTRRSFAAARLAYIKGASFFETLQPTQLERFYLFKVAGMTSAMLTGCREGDGIVARVPAGATAFSVEGQTMRTLMQTIAGQESH
jgi:hypothetical protein